MIFVSTDTSLIQCNKILQMVGYGMFSLILLKADALVHCKHHGLRFWPFQIIFFLFAR